ncbi:MAG: hypothetical protein GC201_18315 [Alphaproteobacteria bacterium]|nr:hypothetical protein [Alphaproteobacteria bacterium]
MRKYWPVVIIAAVIVVVGMILVQQELPTVRDVGGDTPLPKTKVTYHCEGGFDIKATYFDDPDEVVLKPKDGQEVALQRAQSGSGARYADGKNELWEHQGVARITLADGTALEHCTPEED